VSDRPVRNRLPRMPSQPEDLEVDHGLFRLRQSGYEPLTSTATYAIDVDVRPVHTRIRVSGYWPDSDPSRVYVEFEDRELSSAHHVSARVSLTPDQARKLRASLADAIVRAEWA